MKRSGRVIATCVIVACLLAVLVVPFLLSKGGQTIFALFTLNHNSIVFYGKLEDQFGHALTNVGVNFDVRVYNGFRSGVDRGTVMTDKEGFFKISGFNGEQLFVVPRVEGYAIASDNGRGIYSDLWPPNERAHPDAKHPVVIKMWKAQGAEPLIGIDMKFKLPFTNSLSFDLLTGKIVSEGGDIRLTLNRPLGIISVRNPQVWSATFDVVDGGLIASDGRERFTYFAPENGYKTLETIFSTNRLLPTSGIDIFGTGFYVKSRHGRVYAKLGVMVRINESTNDPMYIEFSGIANTNYSRNWEGAPGVLRQKDCYPRGGDRFR